MTATYGFIGNQDYSKRTDSSIVVENIAYWLDVSFVEAGLYTNIDVNTVNYYGEDISELVEFENPEYYLDGQVYQSKFKNWIYEEGINYPAGAATPIVCSGIYINDEFHLKTEASGYLGYHIDYLNGRIIFDNAYGAETAYGSGDLTIKAAFSYKNIYVTTEERTELYGKVFKEMSNPEGTGVFYARENEIPLPVITVSEKKKKWTPQQLGGFKIANRTIACRIYAENTTDRNSLCDILAQQENKKIPSIDWTNSESPLDNYGDINTLFSGVYAAKDAFPYNDSYIKDAEAIKAIEEIPEGTVLYNIDTYNYL